MKFVPAIDASGISANVRCITFMSLIGDYSWRKLWV